MKLGERFIKKDWILPKQIKKALRLQSRTGGKLGDVLMGVANVRAQDYYQLLAEHYQIEFVDLLNTKIDMSLLTNEDHDVYLARATIPIKQEHAIFTVATANPSPETFEFIKKHWGENTHIVATSRFDVLSVLQKRFNDQYVHAAINHLIDSNIDFSAKTTFCIWQIIFMLFIAGMGIYLMLFNFRLFFLLLNGLLTISIAGILTYKLILGTVALFLHVVYRKPPLNALPKHDLPIYTILVPLYGEKEITLKHLFSSLNKLNYPKHKLDVKILLEQDDLHTIQILKKLKLANYYEFIYVPPEGPRTKAKACNYGLKFARGDYLTLYDAEDKPDPYQLKIALDAFNKDKTGKLACIQSRLNFYNSQENWLTRMFTIEYTYWFDLLLPALEYFHTPIPLGGTSNHFKTAILRDIDAWDPYNVAEDADLGIRLERLGYQSKVIASTTYEEANCHLGNWMKQRTRWIKGYMQTFIVHMRNPFKLWYSLGTRGFIGFHLFLGGTIVSNLANVVLWIVFFLFLLLPQPIHANLFPPMIQAMAIFNFFVGFFGMITLNLMGVIARKKYRLLWSAITAPFYWLLISLASYRALYQLFLKPSHWEKTEHGISKLLQ